MVLKENVLFCSFREEKVTVCRSYLESRLDVRRKDFIYFLIYIKKSRVDVI